MCINSFTISNQEFQTVGTGVYLAASILDHSCEPNAVATFEGKTLLIHAISEIPKFDWSKASVAY